MDRTGPKPAWLASVHGWAPLKHASMGTCPSPTRSDALSTGCCPDTRLSRRQRSFAACGFQSFDRIHLPGSLIGIKCQCPRSTFAAIGRRSLFQGRDYREDYRFLIRELCDQRQSSAERFDVPAKCGDQQVAALSSRDTLSWPMPSTWAIRFCVSLCACRSSCNELSSAIKVAAQSRNLPPASRSEPLSNWIDVLHGRRFPFFPPRGAPPAWARAARSSHRASALLISC